MTECINEEQEAQEDIEEKLENEQIKKPKRIIPCVADEWKKNLEEIMQEFHDNKANKLGEQLARSQKRINELDKKVIDILNLSTTIDKLEDEDKVEYGKIKKFHNILLQKANLLKQIQTEKFSEISSRLINEKETILQKLKTRNGIEDVVLQLHREVELLKNHLFHETTRRTEMEILLEEEISELSNLLLLESKSRFELRNKLEQVTTVNSSVFSDLQVLKGNLQFVFLEKKPAIDEDDVSKYSAEQESDFVNLIQSTGDITSKIFTACELSKSDVSEFTSENKQKLIDKLKQQIDHEVTCRKAIEEKSASLEAQINKLEQQLQVEFDHLDS